MVTVYTKPNCMQCVATTKKLTRENIPFTVKDAVESASDLKEMGFLSAPVVTVTSPTGDTLDSWSGYRPDKLRQLL